MKLIYDEAGYRVQGFAPSKGVTYNGSVTVTQATGAKLSSDVSISIDGKTITYNSGDGLILVPGVTYIFGSSVDCHVMV